MARRAITLDPVLGELQARISQQLANQPSIPPREGASDRRTGQRIAIRRPARLLIDILTAYGEIRDVGRGGLFLASEILVEVGEHGMIDVDGFGDSCSVRVAWTRPGSHRQGAGLGLAFEPRDRAEERRVLQLIVSLLDNG